MEPSLTLPCCTLFLPHRSLANRQDGPSCVNQSDCYPVAAPVTLVECLENGLCSCQECFSLNSTINMCYQEFPTCYFYNASLGQCQDERPSQAVAFYLSLALSGVGAANFYIGRNDLGGTQLALLISLFAVVYCVVYAMCCLGCCMGMEKGEILVSQPLQIHTDFQQLYPFLALVCTLREVLL